MTETVIKVSQEFRINGGGLWLGIERSVSSLDEVSEFLKARETLVNAFNAMNSGQAPSITDYHTGEEQTTLAELEITAEFERIRDRITLAETKEEAAQILNGSDFKLNVELKNIVNSKK